MSSASLTAKNLGGKKRVNRRNKTARAKGGKSPSKKGFSKLGQNLRKSVKWIMGTASPIIAINPTKITKVQMERASKLPAAYNLIQQAKVNKTKRARK